MKEKIKQYSSVALKIVLFLGFLVLVYSGFVFLAKSLTDLIVKDILEYIKVLIWPIVILLIAFTFRANISHLIERMDEWEIPFVGKGKAHGALAQQQETIKTDVVVAQNEGEDFRAVVAAKETE